MTQGVEPDPLTPAIEPARGSVSFSDRPAGPGRLRMGIVMVAVVGAVAIAMVAASLALTTRPSGPAAVLAAGASASPAASADPNANEQGDKDKGDKHGRGLGLGLGNGLGLGKGLGLGHGAGIGRDITITSINGTSVGLATADGWTRTITLTSTTTITKGGQPIAASDLEVGDHVVLRQTHDGTTYTVTGLAVIVPRVAGTASKIGASGFTVTDRAGTAWTITTNGATVYRFGSAPGTSADVKEGGKVRVAGDSTGEHALQAITVQVGGDDAKGTVTAKTASTITIKGRDDKVTTIHVGADTTFRVRGKDAATIADIAVGDVVAADGRARSDGSIDASTVVAGKVKGIGNGNGHGPKASAAPSTTP